jgi:hypothetical protein
VRSTTRPALSVRLVTVNVPDPAEGDVTVTVHVPAVPVVHGLGVTNAPAPNHPNAMDALSAGVDVVPSVTVAVTVKLCGAPTGLLADGEIVTAYASHVFDVVAGALNRMSVNITALTDVDAIAVTVNASVPGPASCTTNWHSPSVVPVVRHDDAGSIVPGPGLEAVSVVPADAGTQSGSVGFATPVVWTFAVNVCGTPTKFVALGLSSTRNCTHVFDAVNGTT